MLTKFTSFTSPHRDTDTFLQKVRTRELLIGVIGLGYVGLPLTLLFSEQKFRVAGFDVDQRKIDLLSQGTSYIYRILPEEIAAARSAGFSATADFTRLSQMDAIIICVPTPLNDHHAPDISYIENTAHSIAPNLRPGQLIVLESTTYPGTTEEILIPILENENRVGLKAAREEPAREHVFHVAFSPEREDPGNTQIARRDIPKVIGGVDSLATRYAGVLYNTIFSRVVPVSSPAVAEMTKLLENIYRCVNIALVNELKLLCLRMGINIFEVIQAASTKPFGFQAFQPGPGIGGHCIPIDPFYLSWKAKEFDFHTRFIELAGEVNLSMPYHVVASVAQAMNQQKRALNGAKVLVLGLAYKKDVDDLRESPALTIIELLRKEGADVSYNDPFFPTVGRGRKYDLSLASTPLGDLEEFDCVLIATDHSTYNYSEIVKRAKLVIDTRNATQGIESQNIVHC
jgi:UDP-N-acetyl-D-glucosamine dehydrogenase